MRSPRAFESQSRRTPALLAAFALALTAIPGSAQVSLSAAVNLALTNSPKVKIAQADVAKARAALSESKVAFVPAVAATGGVGKSTGAPLNPPVVFSLAAQSLVFNSSQFDYIRAARAGLDAALLALDSTRSDVVEDATSTYIALNNGLRRRAVQQQALGYAGRLVAVTQDRFNAGVDPHIELTRARHTEAEIQLQELTLEDEIDSDAAHLAQLTGLTARGLSTDPGSIPPLPEPAPAAPDAGTGHTVGISAAFAEAQSKDYTAHGQKHYLLRPQIAFSANYARISTAFTTYTQYYPDYDHPGNSFNSLSFGVELTVPILDMVHRERFNEAKADAAHAFYEAQAQQMQFLEGRAKLRRSAAELAARERLASLDRDLAQDQLDTVLLRLRADAGTAGGEQMTPKDEQNARLQERLRTLDMLSAELQLQQAEVSLLHQEGALSTWLAAGLPAASLPNTSPATPLPSGPLPITPAGPAPTVALPSTVGTPPGAPAPAGTAPVTPTVGTPPAVLPSAPVTHPGAAPSQTPGSIPQPAGTPQRKPQETRQEPPGAQDCTSR